MQRAGRCSPTTRGRFVLSPFVLAEVDYFVAQSGVQSQATLLEEVAAGSYLLAPFDADDVGRAAGIVQQYAELRIGIADASVALLAERHRTTRILTLDERHFRTLRTPRASLHDPACRRYGLSRSTLYAGTGRAKPFSVKTPASSTSTCSSTSASVRWLIRICPSAASSHSRTRGSSPPDRRVVRASLEADLAERRVAERDADAEAELVPALQPRGWSSAISSRSAQREPHGP